MDDDDDGGDSNQEADKNLDEFLYDMCVFYFTAKYAKREVKKYHSIYFCHLFKMYNENIKLIANVGQKASAFTPLTC